MGNPAGGYPVAGLRQKRHFLSVRNTGLQHLQHHRAVHMRLLRLIESTVLTQLDELRQRVNPQRVGQVGENRVHCGSGSSGRKSLAGMASS